MVRHTQTFLQVGSSSVIFIKLTKDLKEWRSNEVGDNSNEFFFDKENYKKRDHY